MQRTMTSSALVLILWAAFLSACAHEDKPQRILDGRPFAYWRVGCVTNGMTRQDIKTLIGCTTAMKVQGAFEIWSYRQVASRESIVRFLRVIPWHTSYQETREASIVFRNGRVTAVNGRNTLADCSADALPPPHCGSNK